MILKLTAGSSMELYEVSRVTMKELPNHSIELWAFDSRGESLGRFIIRDEPPVEGVFEKGYLMDNGKTVEVFRQICHDPVPYSERGGGTGTVLASETKDASPVG